MSSRIFQITMWPGLHLVHWPKAKIDPNMGWHGGCILYKILPRRRNSNICNSTSNQTEEWWRFDGIHQKFQGHSTWLLWSLRGKDTGRDVHDEHDQGVQGSPGELRNLLVCTIFGKSQKNCPAREAKHGQKKCSAGHGSDYWWAEEKDRWERVWYSPANGVFKPNQVSREPIEEEQRDPLFCHLHNYVQHPTTECWALHRLVHHRIKEGTLELSQ